MLNKGYLAGDKYKNLGECGAQSYGLILSPKSCILCGLKMTYNRNIFSFELVS